MDNVEDRLRRRSALNGTVMVVEDCAETENSCWWAASWILANVLVLTVGLEEAGELDLWCRARLKLTRHTRAGVI